MHGTWHSDFVGCQFSLSVVACRDIQNPLRRCAVNCNAREARVSRLVHSLCQGWPYIHTIMRTTWLANVTVRLLAAVSDGSGRPHDRQTHMHMALVIVIYVSNDEA